MLLVINQRVLYICLVMKTKQHQIMVELDPGGHGGVETGGR